MLFSAMDQIRNRDLRLYSAIQSCLTPTCHASHEVKLYLDDLVEPLSLQKRYLGKAPRERVTFKLIFTAPTSLTEDRLWHESEVSVMD